MIRFGKLFSAFKLVSGVRGVLLIASLAFAAGSASALYVKGKFDAAARADTTAQTLKEQRAAARRAILETEARQAIDTEITEHYIATILAQSARSERALKELQSYVPSRPLDCDCGPTVGALGLLDALRAGHHSLRPAEPAELSHAENLAPSAIGELGLLTSHAQCISHYNDIALQLDSLIEWFERQTQVQQGR